MNSLYERLGGTKNITSMAAEIVDLHLKNSVVATRYQAFDVEALKKGAATFIISTVGGPKVYEGKDMLATHMHMNISDAEFNAVLDDILQTLDKHHIGQREKEEFFLALYRLKKEIVHV